MRAKFAAAVVLSVFACFASAVEPKISISDSHVLLLKSDGTVWAWGSNGSGQLGMGTGGSSTATPTEVTGLNGVVDIAAKEDSLSMALKADGTVWVWGNVSNGLSGVPGLSGGVFKDAPFKISTLQQITSIGATFGGFTALAVDSDRKLWAWGRGTSGELGDGLTTTSKREIPEPVAGVTDVVRVAASNQQVVALRADGSVIGWGYNAGNSIGDALLAGQKGVTTIGPSLLNVPKLAFLEAGKSNLYGQYFGLDAQGQIHIWGDTASGLIGCHQVHGSETGSLAQPYTPTGLDNIVQVAGGDTYALFLNASGQVLGCGYNSDGELGDGTTTSTHQSSSPPKPGPVTTQGLPASIVTIAAGAYSSGAIDSAGGVYTWGRRSSGLLSGDNAGSQPTNNTSAVKLSINAGSTSDAPPTYAGTQSGAITSATVDVGVAVAPAHASEQGQIYLAALLNDFLFLLDENGAFVQYDPAKPLPAFYSGALPKRMPLNLARDSDLQSVSGVVLLIGYGLGSGKAADDDLLSSGRYRTVLQLQ